MADRSVHGPRDPPETLRKRRRQKRARPEDAHPAAARSPRCHPAPPLAKPMADKLPCCPHHHLAQKPTSQTSWQRQPWQRSIRRTRKDRKSVVWGKRVTERVESGVRLLTNKQK